MVGEIEVKKAQARPEVARSWPSQPDGLLLWAFAAFVTYLCWLLVASFVPALAFGFALAMLGQPIYAWLLRRLKSANVAALVAVVLICLTIVVPITLVVRVLVQEAFEGIGAIGDQQDIDNLRGALERSTLFGPAIRWVDSKVDLPNEALQAARGLGQWLSRLTASFVSGSARAITQMVTMVVVLFYFLRDQDSILTTVRSFIPLSERKPAGCSPA